MQPSERLLQYVTFSTASNEAESSCPSSAGQLEFARFLRSQLQKLGLLDARVDRWGYVYASLPASEGCEKKRPLGFIAHMDTSPDAPGKGVQPMVWPNYDGKLLRLKNGTVLDPALLPQLSQMRGKTLITSSGDTLLGADDKAGIAEIMTMLERVITQNLPHPKLAVAFTPDEEIGRGADRFDLALFGAPVAYTVDGETPGVVEYETFNAASAVVTFCGVSVHPGAAKGVMKNAAALAAQFAQLLPQDQTPEKTEGRQGFFHLHHMEGTVEKATLEYLLRDHSDEGFCQRKQLLEKLVNQANALWGEGTVSVQITDTYYNMARVLQNHMDLVENALEVFAAQGLSGETQPVRGGTDGSKLSFLGLPCPNLPTGGHAFHGRCEYIAAEDMELCCQTLLGLVERAAR